MITTKEKIVYSRVVPAVDHNGVQQAWAMKQGNLVLAVHPDKDVLQEASERYNAVLDFLGSQQNDTQSTNAAQGVLKELIDYDR